MRRLTEVDRWIVEQITLELKTSEPPYPERYWKQRAIDIGARIEPSDVNGWWWFWSDVIHYALKHDMFTNEQYKSFKMSLHSSKPSTEPYKRVDGLQQLSPGDLRHLRRILNEVEKTVLEDSNTRQRPSPSWLAGVVSLKEAADTCLVQKTTQSMMLAKELLSKGKEL